MQDWADYCERGHLAGDVVPLRQGASAIVPSGPAKRWIAQPTPSHRRSQEVSDNVRTNFITTIERLGQCCCPCCRSAGPPEFRTSGLP
jgi:hypothetical protein